MSILAHLHIEAEKGPMSNECVDRGIISFLSFVEWVEQLPYKRNADRSNYSLVFDEECGTCSTKNALVNAVALENGWNQVQLFLGLYQMSELTNPGIGTILKKANLKFLPEAHVYLKIDNTIRDCTGLALGKSSFLETLSHETEILPDQIAAFKINWHQNHLLKFARDNGCTIDEVNNVREACILRLSQS